MTKTTPVVRKPSLVLLSPETKFGPLQWVVGTDAGYPPLTSGPGDPPYPITAAPVYCFTWLIKTLHSRGTQGIKGIAFQVTNSPGQQLSAFVAIVKGEKPVMPHDVEEFRTKDFSLRESPIPQYIGFYESSVAVTHPSFKAGNRLVLVISPRHDDGVEPKAALTTIIRKTATNRAKS